MSILNFVQFNDHSAVVTVDTLSSSGREVSKLLVIPHLGAVIAGRGRYEVFTTLALRAMVCPTFELAAAQIARDFDEALLAVPEHDRVLAASLGISEEALDARMFGTLRRDEVNAGQQMLLVGPSQAGQLEALHLMSDGPGAPMVTLRHAGVVVGPPNDELTQAAPQMLATDSGALLFALRQFADCPETQRPGYGGRLLVARLNGGRVALRDLGKLQRPSAVPKSRRDASASLGAD